MEIDEEVVKNFIIIYCEIIHSRKPGVSHTSSQLREAGNAAQERLHNDWREDHAGGAWLVPERPIGVLRRSSVVAQTVAA
jgi:hypothetical protein